MEKYKGFLIESGSSQHEEKEWDGHRNSGTGVYTTRYWVRTINLRTKNEEYWSSIQDAKTAIDDRKHNLAVNRKLAAERKKLDKKMKAIEIKIHALNQQKWKLNGQSNDVYNQLRKIP